VWKEASSTGGHEIVIGNILNIARSAIATHQTAVQVAGQNLSNAHTEGYSRQRAVLEPGVSVRTPVGLLGSGVRVTDVTRTRDQLLDLTYRREAGNAAHFELRRDLLGQVEEIFGELDDSGFSRTLDAFWSSWGDLASNPTGGSVRGLIKLNGQQLVHSLHNFSHRLDTLQQNVGERMERTVQDVNVLASRLADVNRQVRLAESTGRSAPDLRDERDRVLDHLSRLVPLQVVERSDGTLGVFVGTVSLVDGGEARELVLDAATQKLRIGSSTLQIAEGELGALTALREQDIPHTRARLDHLAQRLVEEVNAVHFAGTGRNFFDPSGRSARAIALSDDIRDSGHVGLVPDAPGDNRVALELAGLREALISFPGSGAKSFGAFYGETVADVGLRVNSAERSATIYDTLASHADLRRSRVSGVSSDEELMQLMRHQQAYAAATRLVSAADEMLKSILAMV
jgi:flagellar hook-associated protein 1